MQKIIIYLQSDNLEEATAAVISASGGVQKIIDRGNLNELKTLAAENEVIVIAPAEAVVLTEAKLPKLNRHRLLQALPYAIEEQLLTDINDLHFALGEYQPEGIIPVAIVTKQKMNLWLAALGAIDVFPSAILPATLSVPYLDNCWNIFVNDGVAIARTHPYRGFSCDKQNLQKLIQLALADQIQKPQAIYLENYTNDPLAMTIPDANLVEKNKPQDKFLENLAHKTDSPIINLLQAPYQPKHKPSQNKKIWALAGYLIIACVALTFFTNLVSYGILHYQTAALEKNIANIYKRNFPNATSIVAPKERMIEKLNNLLNQGNKNRLLLWLAALGKSLAEVNGIQVKQIDYRNNQLSLEFSTRNADTVDELTKSLKQQGMTVKQQNVAANGSEVKGTLLITENKS